jgi:hypothetical protein
VGVTFSRLVTSSGDRRSPATRNVTKAFTPRSDFVEDVADFNAIGVSYFPIVKDDDLIRRSQIVLRLDLVYRQPELPAFNSKRVAGVSRRISNFVPNYLRKSDRLILRHLHISFTRERILPGNGYQEVDEEPRAKNYH